MIAGKLGRAFQIIALMVAGMFPWTVAEAQKAAADSLEGQLATQYKLVKLGTDSTGIVVLEPGTVLAVKKGGILSFPSNDASIMPTVVKDGAVHSPNAAVAQTFKKDTKFLTVGEKVYVFKMEIHRKDSKVALRIVECDSCNGAADPSYRKAQVVFQFPNGYLDNADAGQISDVIAQVLEVESGEAGQDQGQDNQGGPQAQAQEPAPQQAAPPPAAAPAGKKRVAVMSFDYGTVRSYVSAIFGSDQDVGKGISDLLVTKLVQDGKYSVIERNALDKIIGEQNFANSDRADANTAAKIGKILGIDAIIIGSITQFGRDDQHTNVGGGGYGLGRFGLGGVGTSKAKAVVGISTRMVNTTTGEILVAVNGTGESTRSSTSLLGAGGGWSGGGGGSLDMGSSNFANTILGEAVKKAVEDTGTQLDASVDKIPTIKLEVNGVVADVSGSTLIVNVGKRAGVKVGDKLSITRQVRVVKDPTTGKVIKSVENKVGEATVTEVDNDSATATFSGTGSAKVGDVVKN